MKAKVTANGVRLYESNSTISAAKGFAKYGEELDIEAEFGGWCKLADGRWVEACFTEAIDVSGGSGGGVSSWNDLTDKPFEEISGIEFVCIKSELGEPSFTVESEDEGTTQEYYLVAAGDFPKESFAKLEIVKVDDAGADVEAVEKRYYREFSTPCLYFPLDEYGDYTWLCLYDGKKTAESVDGTVTPQAGIYVIKGSIPSSFRGYCDAEVITLDPKFLPDSVKGAMKNIITQTADYEMSANFTYADVVEQLNAGVCPLIYLLEEDKAKYVMCSGMIVTDEELYFDDDMLHVRADGQIYYDA